MVQLVRQLPLGEYGLPRNIYAFPNDTEWTNYENMQSEIFDQLLAVVHNSDLGSSKNQLAMI